MNVLVDIGLHLVSLVKLIGHTLTFNSSYADTVMSGPNSGGYALGVAMLAAFSIILGQLGVLAINRLSRFRLLFAVVAAMVGVIIQFICQGVILWLLGRIFLDDMPHLETIIKIMLVSTAPLTFAFLVILPMMGPSVEFLLGAWSLGIMWGLVVFRLDLEWYAALIMTLASWAGMQVVGKLVSKPLGRARDAIWLKLTGKPLLLTSQALLDAYPAWHESVTELSREQTSKEEDRSAGKTRQAKTSRRIALEAKTDNSVGQPDTGCKHDPKAVGES